MPKTSAKNNSASNKPRRLKRPGYRPLWMGKRIKTPANKLPSGFRIFIKTFTIMEKRWKVFSIIAGLYLALTVIMVKGMAGSADVSAIKDAVNKALNGQGNDLTVGFSVLGTLVGQTANPSNQAAGVYQMVLFVCFSLVIIWAFRQAYAKTSFTVRDAFYKAPTPLVPFVIVLLVMGLQLLPLILANLLYGVVLVQGVARTTIEQIVWGGVLIVLVSWSVWMVTRTMVALYIVTLPETPLRALRSARDLVRYRRWTVIRKILFLPLVLFIIGASVMLPVILVLPSIAEFVLSALAACSLVVVHGYLYTLYRELL
jgi:hypothetical protein